MIKPWCATLLLIIMMGLCFSQSALADIQVITKDSKASIADEGGGVWSLRQNGDRYVIETSGSGRYVFKKGSQTLATGTMKNEKLKLISNTGDVYATIKFKATKIKVSADGSANPYEFKVKPGKLKVVMGGVDQGKIKYYPKNGKVKAKDRLGETRAEFKGLSGLSAAPGVYLIPTISQEKRACLTLIMLMMGK